jgi:siroheme decarboxylase
MAGAQGVFPTDAAIRHMAPEPGSVDFRLLNDYQRDFPLIARPFAAIGTQTGLDESAVLARFRSFVRDGVVSRIGAVFAPRRLGASALAALSAPPGRIETIAARVNAFPEVNHNYLREHAFNLWFVITAESGQRLAEVVEQIERDTGCKVLVLPLEEEFHIDLGFCLAGGTRDAAVASTTALPALSDSACALPEAERSLTRVLQDGMPLDARPFETLGRSVGLSEQAVIEMIERWQADGLVKRFGVVVRHHELGFRANAMCVWDVADDQVSAMGHRLATAPEVTLCYRRSRVLPHWRYNLFCMIHGKSRDEVLATRDDIATRLDLDRWPHAVLFSTRRFKQRGAQYLPSQTTMAGADE